MDLMLTFEDTLIVPKFSNINSRKDVSLDNGYSRLPVISSNMDTITSVEMAKAMKIGGGLACLHRFWSIEDNVTALEKSVSNGQLPWVSVGVGELEYKRAEALYEAGARCLILDVANGAQLQVVKQYKRIKETLIDAFVVVGNFATYESCADFWKELNKGAIPYYRNGKGELSVYGVDGFKIGIGSGANCITRIKTGIGIPQLAAIIDVCNGFKNHAHKPLIIADGGCQNSGAVAKALGAGADMVMLGSMLSGTEETPGKVVSALGSPLVSWNIENKSNSKAFEGQYKKYRGSASKESYKDQGKTQEYITEEGVSTLVPYKGPVANILQDIEGGLRSAFTYTGSRNLEEFHKNVEFVRITNAGIIESRAYSKNEP